MAKVKKSDNIKCWKVSVSEFSQKLLVGVQIELSILDDHW